MARYLSPFTLDLDEIIHCRAAEKAQWCKVNYKCKWIIYQWCKLQPIGKRDWKNQEDTIHFFSSLMDNSEVKWVCMPLFMSHCKAIASTAYFSTSPHTSFALFCTLATLDLHLPNTVSVHPLSLLSLFSHESKLRQFLNAKLYLLLPRDRTNTDLLFLSISYFS